MGGWKNMRVLSLFDGISCGMVALERAGIEVDKYYASEIEPSSEFISKNNYSEIIRLGDVTKWKEWDVDWNEIDLIIGGSPCQGFSFAGKQLNFDDFRSKLFFDYVDILNHLKSINPNIKFLLENVLMKKEYEDVITNNLKENPIILNSENVSAQKRERLYWFNWEIDSLKKEKDYKLIDIFDGSLKHRIIKINHPESIRKCKSYYQYDQNLLGHNSQDQRYFDCNGKCNTLLKSSSSIPKVKIGEEIYLLTPEECEKLQTLPVGYTSGVPNGKRYEALGNGWTVDVIAHIFSFLPDEYKKEDGRNGK
jgi:site-specific DNA-cytosine methylase